MSSQFVGGWSSIATKPTYHWDGCTISKINPFLCIFFGVIFLMFMIFLGMTFQSIWGTRKIIFKLCLIVAHICILHNFQKSEKSAIFWIRTVGPKRLEIMFLEFFRMKRSRRDLWDEEKNQKSFNVAFETIIHPTIPVPTYVIISTLLYNLIIEQFLMHQFCTPAWLRIKKSSKVKQ